MLLDPPGEARRWFLKAQDDLRAGNLDLAATPPLVLRVLQEVCVWGGRSEGTLRGPWERRISAEPFDFLQGFDIGGIQRPPGLPRLDQVIEPNHR